MQESLLLLYRFVVLAWDEGVKKVVYRNNGLQNRLCCAADTFVEKVILNVIGQLQKSLVSLKL